MRNVTDTQLYIAIGIPTIAVLVGMLINGMQFNALNARMASMDSRTGGLETCMTHLESKFDMRFDMLIGKVVDIDNRLTRLEARFEHN